MPLAIGHILENRYRIENLLGTGGMGAVYRAAALRFNAPVAIKENLETSREGQRQFARKAALLHTLRQVHGAPGDTVRTLAAERGIRRTRFRPVLPLGRTTGYELDVLPETLWGHMHPRELVAYGFEPMTSCGMVHDLYVEPDGGAYPC